MHTKVIITKKAQKELDKLPDYIVQNLEQWVIDVTVQGLSKIRKISGYHDEPLQGARKGQRSIRLSKSYRAFYTIVDGEIEIVNIIEVNKHKY